MDNEEKKFPESFIFGTSTSAFQIEGEGNTEWKGFIGKDGTQLGNATDHYNRIDEDLEYIVELGDAYRFSMDWSKLQKGAFLDLDEKAVKHYEKIFKKLKDNNMKAMLVLNHFSNPSWFMEKGGWTNPESVEAYGDYAAQAMDRFGEKVDFVNTFNEPGIYGMMAYLTGDFPPHKRAAFISRSKILNNMSESHKRFYEYSKQINPRVQIGISKAWTKFDKLSRYTGVANTINKLLMTSVDELFAGTNYVDFVGTSYYGKSSLYSLTGNAKNLDRKGIPHDDMWILYPKGIYEIIKYFDEKYQKPVFITENGTCTNDDELRIKNTYNHLKQVHKAMAEGCNVVGYNHWSAFDNFELDYGPSRRFGLVSVNFDSPKLERKMKKSGEYYSKLAKTKLLEKPR